MKGNAVEKCEGKAEDLFEKEVKEVPFEEELLIEPPYAEVPRKHVLWPAVKAALCDVYDPEIPVNLYELGLIYKVDIQSDGDIYIQMTLTSPACPVAQDMPVMVREAIEDIDGVGNIEVELIWDPPWDPSMMAETARMELNMFG